MFKASPVKNVSGRWYFSNMENLQGFEGLSALEESAVRLHEIYKSLMTAGFTEDQALSLIAKMTKSGPNP